VQEANMEIRKQLSFFFKKKLLDLKGGPRIQNDERGKKTTKNPIFQSSYETNKQRDRNREGSKIAGTTQRKMWNRKTTLRKTPQICSWNRRSNINTQNGQKLARENHSSTELLLGCVLHKS